MADTFDTTAFGRFRLLGRIASSRLGPLFDAVDELLGRHVSIRFVPQDLLDPGRFARLRSVEIGSGIAKLIDWGRAKVPSLDEGQQRYGYLVSLPIDGEPLSASIFELTEEVWLRVLANMAMVLAAAHRAGIVHGLLTPDSVFVARDGTVTIADFGLSPRAARLLDSRYVAQEVQEGNRPTPQSDQYSLGAIARERWDRIPPSSYRSFARIEVFKRCLNPNPYKRYASTDELLGDLLRSIEGNARPLAVNAMPAASASYASWVDLPGSALLEEVRQLISKNKRALVIFIFGIVLSVLLALSVFVSRRAAGPIPFDAGSTPGTMPTYTGTTGTMSTGTSSTSGTTDTSSSGTTSTTTTATHPTGSDNLVFNTWFAQHGMKESKPEERLTKGETYDVALDLSRIAYLIAGANPSEPAKAVVEEIIRAQGKDSLEINVRPVLLGRGLQWPAGGRTVRTWKDDAWSDPRALTAGESALMTIYLKHTGPSEAPSNVDLREHFASTTAPYRLGGIQFKVYAANEGCAAIALTLWKPEAFIPLDRIVVTVPVGNAHCSVETGTESERIGAGFLTILANDSDLKPVAALHLFEIHDANDGKAKTAAVYVARGQSKDCDSYSWETKESISAAVSAVSFTDSIDQARVTEDYSNLASALDSRLFPAGDRSPCGSRAALADMKRLSEKQHQKLFATLVDESDLGRYLPMRIVFALRDGKSDVFRYPPTVLQPLPRVSYTAGDGCIADVAFVFPSALKDYTEPILSNENVAMLKKYGRLLRNQGEFDRYMGEAEPEKRTLLLLLSHHTSEGGIYFDDPKHPWLTSDRVKEFAAGSAMVMAACSSGSLSDKHTNIVDDFNGAGMDAAILAPFDIPSEAGVLFARNFALETVRARKSGEAISLADLFDRARDSSLAEARNNQKGDNRVRMALEEFFLAGNGALRVCGK